METIKGFYTKTIFKNEKTGFTIFQVKTEKSLITCAGNIQNLPYYTPLTLCGHYDKDSKYPDTFHIDSDISFKGSKQTMLSYLIHSAGIKDMDFDTAEKIVDGMDGDIFEAVKKCETQVDFEKICPMKEISGAIYQKTKKILEIKTLFEIISMAGGTYSDAMKIRDLYEDDSLYQIKNNPYAVSRMIGLNFSIADKIGEYFKFTRFSPKRAKSMLAYSMDMIMSQGNTYALLEELKNNIAYLNKNGYLGETPDYYILSFLIDNDNYVLDKKYGLHVYYKNIKEAEDNLIRNVKRIYESNKSNEIKEDIIEKIQEEEHINLANDQLKVFESIKRSGIKIVTGGPGCGKTTTISLLIKYIEKMFDAEDICLCAPTGCAAQKLMEKTGHTASTIHYKIGAKPFDGMSSVDYNFFNQLPYRFYIIEEFSMADLELVSMLFDAIPNESTVIIVGDPDQLESVGPGNVLHDFIDSGMFEVYRLNTIFRQANGSLIIENAGLIKEGNASFLTGEDFVVKEEETEDLVFKDCTEYLKNLSNKNDDFQVLCPIKKNTVGTKNLNILLQSFKTKSEISKTYGDYTFYLNDKVITTKNNRKKGYFNGEPGIVTDIDNDGIEVTFANDIIYIKNSSLDEVIPAHALTVHKSQGNEYPEVVLLLTESSKGMISKKILYTAITRAKEKVTLFYQSGVFDNIETDKVRHTDLADRLMECIV